MACRFLNHRPRKSLGYRTSFESAWYSKYSGAVAGGGFTGGALTAWDQGLSGGDFWKMAGYGALVGGAGGLVAGGAIASGVPILSGHSISSGLGSLASGGVDNMLNGRGFFENWGASFGIGFGAAWATGIINREINTDGEIEYDKRGRLKGTKNGDILAFTSATSENSSNTAWDSFIDWTWSTMVGGYSHVTSNRKGRISQYGKKAYRAGKYKGRSYKIIGGRSEGIRYHYKKGFLKRSNYSLLSRNCSTTCSMAIKIPQQWSPYNVHSHFNTPQFIPFVR